VCGYDFVSGHVPGDDGTSEPTPIDPELPPHAGPSPLDAEPPSHAGPARPDPAQPSRGGWRLIVDADRTHYERVGPDDISFPAAFAQRVFDVCGDVVVVGRGDGRGPGPDIDLAGEPEDVAVSRRHVLLERAADGSYTLLDPGSTNGTLVNEADRPLPPGRRIVLKDRDRLFIGAWTRIVVRTG
jgi:hypothetical protein